jgi:hypothetical protein
LARAPLSKAKPQERQIIIVAENALSDYDVVNFDLTNCTAGNAGEALMQIYRYGFLPEIGNEQASPLVQVSTPQHSYNTAAVKN